MKNYTFFVIVQDMIEASGRLNLESAEIIDRTDPLLNNPKKYMSEAKTTCAIGIKK